MIEDNVSQVDEINKNNEILRSSSGEILLGNTESKPEYLVELNHLCSWTLLEWEAYYLLPQNSLYKPKKKKKKRSRSRTNDFSSFLPQNPEIEPIFPYNFFPGYSRFLQSPRIEIADLIKLFPEDVNWLEKGQFDPAIDQKACSSCYAIATVTTIAARHAIKTRKKISLSIQELIDCDTENEKCKGGQPQASMDYIKKNAINYE